jgi:hypothetical protein
MLRCAAFFVTAAYEEVRLIPQNLRALPLGFLRSRIGWIQGLVVIKSFTGMKI